MGGSELVLGLSRCQRAEVWSVTKAITKNRSTALTKIAGLDIGELISRAPGRGPSNTTDEWSTRHTSTFRVVGRHVLNLWRIMRTELELSMYTLENTVFHLLRRR